MSVTTNVYTCIANMRLDSFSFIATNNTKQSYSNTIDSDGNGSITRTSTSARVVTTTVDDRVFTNSVEGVELSSVTLNYTRKTYTKSYGSWRLQTTENFSEDAVLIHSTDDSYSYSCDVYTTETDTTRIVQTCNSTINYAEAVPVTIDIVLVPAIEKCESETLSIKIDDGGCAITTTAWEEHTNINGSIDYYVSCIEGTLLLSSSTHSSANPLLSIVSSAEAAWSMSDYAQPFEVPELETASAWSWDSVPRWSWKMGSYAYIYDGTTPVPTGTGFYIMREGVPKKMNFFIVKNGNVRGLTFKIKKEGENG